MWFFHKTFHKSSKQIGNIPTDIINRSFNDQKSITLYFRPTALHDHAASRQVKTTILKKNNRIGSWWLNLIILEVTSLTLNTCKSSDSLCLCDFRENFVLGEDPDVVVLRANQQFVTTVTIVIHYCKWISHKNKTEKSPIVLATNKV